jgi:hypothetical protein
MNPKEAAAKLQKLGRKDDTVLAHINPREAEMLRKAGGAGTRNPKTGLLEFDDGDGFGGGLSDGYTAPAPGASGVGGGSIGFDGASDAPPTSGSDMPGGDPSAGQINMSGQNTNFTDSVGGFGLDPLDPGSAGIPPADPRGGVGRLDGMPGQSIWDSPMGRFFKRMGQAKATQLAMGAFGIPGAAVSLLASPLMAAFNAKPGERMDAFGRQMAGNVGNSVANAATGGMFGGLGMSMKDITGSGRAPTNGPDGKPTGASGGRYDSSVDYARGAMGLLSAYQMAQAGKGTDAERVAGGQLSGLLRDPSSVTSLPGFKAGMQAVQRSAAGQGYLQSGNLTTALADYGSKFYNDSISTLNQISNQNAGVNQRYKENSIGLLGQSLGSLGYAYSRDRMQQPNISGGIPPSYDFGDL